MSFQKQTSCPSLSRPTSRNVEPPRPPRGPRSTRAGRRGGMTSGKRKRLYLVLRARRACNHRGTAKRPSTPSHSALSPFYFSPASPSAPPPLPPTPRPRSHVPASHRGTTFLRPVRPLTLSSSSSSSSSSSPARGASPRHAAVRPLYNHYRLSQPGRVRCSCLFLSAFPPSAAPSFLSLSVCTLCPPLSASTASSVTNWPTSRRRRLSAPAFPILLEDLSSRCACWPISEPANARARARASISSLPAPAPRRIDGSRWSSVMGKMKNCCPMLGYVLMQSQRRAS